MFCLHHARTLSLCLWDARIGIGVEGTARVRNARLLLGPLYPLLRIGPLFLSPYIGSRRAENLRDVTFPVIGTEYAGADVVRYHLEASNPDNALLLYRWSNCEPSCAAARWVWRLSMEYPSAARHITLSPGA
jgi:hypothetical protein